MDLSNLPKMGPKSLDALKSAGIVSLTDFLYNIPRTYLDQTKVTQIANLKVGTRAVVIGKILRAGIVPGRTIRFIATLADGTGELSIVFFQGASYQSKRLQVGSRWVTVGVVGEFRGFQMTHPDMQPIDENEEFNGEILPVYHMTDLMVKSRITQRAMRNWYSVVFNFPGLTLAGICPKELTDYLHFLPIIECLKNLHQPASFDAIYKAKHELKVLELLPFCLRMIRRRQNQMMRGHVRNINLELLQKSKEQLPFKLTKGQENALNEIVAGLSGKKQFHALLQGDVGCGKTVVAMLSMLAVCNSNEQCAIMVPTDILARQHFKLLKPFFETFGMRVLLLVGATSSAEKKQILGELQMGLCQVVVGTHALYSKDVIFNKLGLVIIDEQHRFGVSQRESLLAKGEYPDMLVMSATPIPRSLAMTLYGDLQVISIKEKPAGRKPVKTRLIPPEKRNDMKRFICAEAKKGNLCYWIVSRVENDDEGNAYSVNDVVEELRNFDNTVVVEGIHGQMDENVRDNTLKRFAQNQVHILVATTVIEVGVNVPEANIMAIDSPERFGLAQLHQLRGRVGRGNVQAWCFLMLPQKAEDSIARLTQFCSTNDGFEIAELDMQMRGAGNLEGNEQSGSWVFRWFDWIHDKDLIATTLQIANNILKDSTSFSEVAREKIQQWYNENKSANKDGVH